MSKKIIIIVAAVLLIGGGAGGYYYFFMARKHKVAKAAPPPPPPPIKLAYVDVKEMTLRLADTNSEHYIKLSPALGVPVAKSDEMTDKLPVVRDRIVTVVSAHTSQDLLSPTGENKLKNELMTALHRDFHEDVVAIYFSDYLVE